LSIVTENGDYRYRDSDDGLEGKELVSRGRGCEFIASMDIQCSAETSGKKRETCCPSITCWEIMAHSTSVPSQTNRILQGALFLLPKNTRN